MISHTLIQRLKRIISISFPQILLMTSQNLTSLVDMYIVGNIGLKAISSVGLCSFIFSVMVCGLMGIMIAVQSTVAKKKGQANSDDSSSLQSGIILGFLFGILILSSIPIIPTFFTLILKDQELIQNCIDYSQTLLISAPAFGVIRAFRGHFSGIEKNFINLKVILLIHFSNILISYLLVLGAPGVTPMGVSGAGLGTSISLYLGVASYMFYDFFLKKEYSFFKTKFIYSDFVEVFRLSSYAGIQQLFFSGIFAAIFIIASKMGPEELAILTLLNNIMLTSVMPLLGLGLGSATLVGNSLGAQLPQEAKRWGNETVLIGFFIFIIQLISLSFLDEIVLLILKNEILVTRYYLLFKITIFSIFFEIFAQILKYSMLGAGYNRSIAKITIILQWIIFIPVVYFFCILKSYSIWALWISFLTYRAIEGLWMRYLWHKEKWNYIKNNN